MDSSSQYEVEDAPEMAASAIVNTLTKLRSRTFPGCNYPGPHPVDWWNCEYRTAQTAARMRNYKVHEEGFPQLSTQRMVRRPMLGLPCDIVGR